MHWFVETQLKKNIWYKVLCEIIENDNYGFRDLGFSKNVNLEFMIHIRQHKLCS